MSVRRTFEELALTPKMGAICGFRKTSIRNLRRWAVQGFENWLIFYRVKRGGIEIVHLMHGARDIEGLLDK